MTKEEALEAKGRYGKTPGGNGYYYGQVVEFDASGTYALFRRGNKFKDRWVHSKDVTLHPVTPNVEFSGVPAGHSSNHPAGGTSAGTQG